PRTSATATTSGLSSRRPAPPSRRSCASTARSTERTQLWLTRVLPACATRSDEHATGVHGSHSLPRGVLHLLGVCRAQLPVVDRTSGAGLLSAHRRPDPDRLLRVH